MKKLFISILFITICSFSFADTIQFQSVDISTGKVHEPEILVKTDEGTPEPNIEMQVSSKENYKTVPNGPKYLNVSEDYAKSIFREVGEIVYAYLQLVG